VDHQELPDLLPRFSPLAQQLHALEKRDDADGDLRDDPRREGGQSERGEDPLEGLFDLLLGSASSKAALFWPRAHVRSLLGGEPLLGLGQGTALAMLLASALTVILVALRRAPD
jgi:hypothetical protein